MRADRGSYEVIASEYFEDLKNGNGTFRLSRS